MAARKALEIREQEHVKPGRVVVQYLQAFREGRIGPGERYYCGREPTNQELRAHVLLLVLVLVLVLGFDVGSLSWKLDGGSVGGAKK